MIWDKAQNFAYNNHKGQLYGDKPYYYHLLNVFDMYRNINTTIDYWEEQKIELQLCWTHDLVEDCEDITLTTLREKGFPEVLVKAIDAISKREGETSKEYLKRCMENPYAHKVKIADTLSNLTESVKEGNACRINKYTKQLNILHKDTSND
jgi:(p)ppGpp synthase/HD superfamily hydrolase